MATRVVVEYNPTFAQAMLAMGVGVEVCWPARGRGEGRRRRSREVGQWLFFEAAALRLDDHDLAQQLAEWHVTSVNTVRPSRATGVIPSVRLAGERARFRLLRVSVRIVAGRFEASSERLFERGQGRHCQVIAARSVAAVSRSGKRGKLFEAPAARGSVPSSSKAYLTEIVHCRPLAWNPESSGCTRSLGTYRESALTGATHVRFASAASVPNASPTISTSACMRSPKPFNRRPSRGHSHRRFVEASSRR
ncbi:MAG: hypothetical protein U0270_37570 [Labilithrix sp.]